jgi:hypothetical protein
VNGTAAWMGVLGSGLQLLGSVMTLWGLLSATETGFQRVRALVGALWRSPASAVAAALSDLNQEDKARVLQGLAILALGYLLSLVSQISLVLWSW